MPGAAGTPARTAAFDGATAEATAREIVESAPEREPGSDGDAAAADLVAERFAEIGAGTVAEQDFESSFEGGDVTLRNVVLTLPGESERTVLVVAAARLGPRPDGAASSAAATAVLLELASYLGSSEHTKTIVLVSTDGASEGAAGRPRVAREAAEPEPIDAVVAIGPAAASADPAAVRSSAPRPGATAPRCSW